MFIQREPSARGRNDGHIEGRKMGSKTLTVNRNSSGFLEELGVLISVLTTYGTQCDVVVGSPGTRFLTKPTTLRTGGIILCETAIATFDVRVLQQTAEQVTFLVTQLIPNFNVASSFLPTEPDNTPFTTAEIEQITESIAQVKLAIAQQVEISAEQLALIHAKLEDIAASSARLGRKDWINNATGLLTSTCVSAAFHPTIPTAIFFAMNSAFSWLLTSPALLLN